MDKLTMNVEEHLAQATAAGIDMLVFATDHPFSPMPAIRRYVEGSLNTKRR
jgi:3-oxoacyl-[acyl-carrier-protein] synthase III